MARVLSAEEIVLMRASCKLAARVLVFIEKYVCPGVKTRQLDKLCHDFILSHKAAPAPLNYNGFPKSVCTSVNSCVCHGVPDDTVLKQGDIVNIDVTCVKDGFYGDTSKTFYVGEVSRQAKALTECAFLAMRKGIEAITAYGRTGDIGFAIEKYVTRKGFFPVREIGGHGIGSKFHEEPFVPSFGKKGRGDILKPWSCITVEPMINQNTSAIKEFPITGSSIKYYHTADNSLSAQFEHTVLITDGKEKNYEILTQLDTDDMESDKKVRL